FEPVEWLSGSVDYFNIEISDRVANISSQTIINCLNGSQTNCPPGLSNFDPSITPPDPSLGLGLARGPAGNIVFLQRGSASLGTLETNGFDINLRGNFDLGNWGRITSDVQGTYTMEYIVDGGDNVAGSKNPANESIPRWRAGKNTVWAIGDFAFSWNMNYTSRIDRAIDATDLDGLESWITHDLQANWYAPWNGQITVGVQNVANRDPVLDTGEGDGYDFDLYDAYGRVPYIRYTQRF
ncbi:MAG: TonB-dependent receptor, partial [Pseudomonadota bacterium]